MYEIRDARAMMRGYMSERGMVVDDAARSLQISVRLLEEILAGGYTHPKIAQRIQKTFGLTDYEVRQLVSPNHVDDVIGHQVGLRNDKFYGGSIKIYSERDAEYASYKDKKFGRSQKA